MSRLWALLLGVDDYFPDRLPDGTRYPSLHGPSRDVARMALLLRDRYGLEPQRTRMLVSRAGEDGQPAEPPERLPTYANLVAAFRQLAADARPGDRVYIHYAGHGARVPTDYGEIKGPSAQDEALVPCDIGDPASRYLRDLELASLVGLLVDRQLLVTIVLDCCHAGGAMRGGAWQAVPRKVFRVRPDPVPSAVASPAELAEVWRRLQKERPAYRGLELQGGPPVTEYALFAACRPDELAFEYPFERGEPQGALTYWLLDTLRRAPDEPTCGEVHQRLVARVRGLLVTQTPMFLGPADRGFLTQEKRSVRALASPVALRVGDDRRVLFDIGLAAGARVGSRVVTRQAELEIRQVGATESWAQVIRVLGPGEIEPGTSAELLPLRAVVSLVPPAPGDRSAERALSGLGALLRARPNGFLDLCDGGGVPDLCVTIGEDGFYEILDPGGIPFPNLRPLRMDAPGALDEVIRRLDHLAKFRNILSVENPRPVDWLGIGLELPGGRAPSSFDLKAGESLDLRLVNRSRRRLDFTVLDLAPDYGVTQLLPVPGGFNLLPLDPGEVFPLPVKGWLPAGYDAGNDILKVFATLGSVSYRWLELPALDRQVPATYDRHHPRTPLERLFARLAAHQPARRGLTPSEFPEEEWITAQVEIRVRR